MASRIWRFREFPGRDPRQGTVLKHDPRRHFESSDLALHRPANGIGVQTRPVARHNHRHQFLAQAVMGDPERNGFLDSVALVERILNPEAADVLAAADDDVLEAVDEVDEFVLVNIREIAGPEPSFLKGLGRGLRIVPVTSDHGRSPHPKLPCLAASQP